MHDWGASGFSWLYPKLGTVQVFFSRWSDRLTFPLWRRMITVLHNTMMSLMNCIWIAYALPEALATWPLFSVPKKSSPCGSPRNMLGPSKVTTVSMSCATVAEKGTGHRFLPQKKHPTSRLELTHDPNRRGKKMKKTCLLKDLEKHFRFLMEVIFNLRQPIPVAKQVETHGLLLEKSQVLMFFDLPDEATTTQIAGFSRIISRWRPNQTFSSTCVSIRIRWISIFSSHMEIVTKRYQKPHAQWFWRWTTACNILEPVVWCCFYTIAANTQNISIYQNLLGHLKEPLKWSHLATDLALTIDGANPMNAFDEAPQSWPMKKVTATAVKHNG